MDQKHHKNKRILYLAGLLFLVLQRFAKVLPTSGALFLGSLLGRLAHPFFSRERFVMQTQLGFAFRSEPEQKKRFSTISRECFAHAGESVAELIVQKRLLSKYGNVSSAVTHSGDEEAFHRAIKAGGGVLALSGHIGSFELLAASHIARGVPVTVIARRPNYLGMSDLLANIRERYGAEIIWRDDPRGGKKLVQTFRNGKVLSMLLDQDTELESAFPDFFGIPAATPVAAVRLAVRFKIPIFTTFIIRIRRAEHQVLTRSLLYDPQQAGVENSILQEYSTRLEHLVREYPSQWLWWHRRWRREPGIDYAQHPDLLRGTVSYVEWLTARS